MNMIIYHAQEHSPIKSVVAVNSMIYGPEVAFYCLTFKKIRCVGSRVYSHICCGPASLG